MVAAPPEARAAYSIQQNARSVMEIRYLSPRNPAASLLATGEDMAHFMVAHLNGGEYRGTPVLAPATIARMHQSHFTMHPRAEGACYGFWENTVNGARHFAQRDHSGLQEQPRDDPGRAGGPVHLGERRSRAPGRLRSRDGVLRPLLPRRVGDAPVGGGGRAGPRGGGAVDQAQEAPRSPIGAGVYGTSGIRGRLQEP